MPLLHSQNAPFLLLHWQKSKRVLSPNVGGIPAAPRSLPRLAVSTRPIRRDRCCHWRLRFRFRNAIDSSLLKLWLKNLQSETGILANGCFSLKRVLVQVSLCQFTDLLISPLIDDQVEIAHLIYGLCLVTPSRLEVLFPGTEMNSC
ncbi:uncharacterized protein LOC131174506 [Hevea brasiliensis]|uniref:uncharacterized protein LOC131174506 n=1 Tax=Hevea brasiliensis TaxID=3981 RepID=UPI0025EC1D16|nr:uncharacterized protein LOC131174506 [Hevea brasiliensis]